MKKTIIALFALLGVWLAGAISVSAQTITDSQSIVYNILTEPSGSEPGTCEVGDNKTYSENTVVAIPDYVESNGDKFIVVGIAKYAFGSISSEKNQHVERMDLSGCTRLQSIGEYAFSGCTSLTSIELPTSLTELGRGAFYDCSSLTSIDIPDLVTEIGMSTFSGCGALGTVKIGTSVKTIKDYVFSRCTALTKLVYNAEDCSSERFSSKSHWLADCKNLSEVVIGDNVKVIPDYAFYNCSALTSIEIPYSVEEIGRSAFTNCRSLVKLTLNAEACSGDGFSSNSDYYWLWNCMSLSEIIIGDNVKAIPDNAFRSCYLLTSIEIPSSVTKIGNYAFTSCDGLTSVKIPATVTTIGAGAFYWCDGLTSVEISPSVTEIGSSTFSKCRALTSVEIPASVKTIGSYAFYECSSLTSVEIPGSVEEIGDHAFAWCTRLNSVEIPVSVKTIGGSAFSNNWLKKITYNAEDCSGEGFTADSYWLYDCPSLAEIVIGPQVKAIPTLAFANNTRLKKITFNAEHCIGGQGGTKGDQKTHWLNGCTEFTEVIFGENVKTIPAHAFDFCKGLTSIKIPDSVTSIGEYAFFSCSGLKTVEIGASVTDIGHSAFGYCSGITSLEIPESVTTIGDLAFYECNYLGSIDMGPGITYIGANAFSDCGRLKEVIINDLDSWCEIEFDNEKSNPIYYSGSFRLKEHEKPMERIVLSMPEKNISDFAFYNAQNLKTIRVEAQSIGKSTFENCSSVTDLFLNVKNIGEEGLFRMSSLQTIYSVGYPPGVVYENILSRISGIKLYVQSRYLNDYETSPYWYRFYPNIIPIDFDGVEDMFTDDREPAASGIGTILDNSTFRNVVSDIYTLGGVLVKRGAMAADIKFLPPGIYVIGGKKVLVK